MSINLISLNLVNIANSAMLGSASGSTHTHTHRQTKLGEGKGLKGGMTGREAGGTPEAWVSSQGVGGGGGWVGV